LDAATLKIVIADDPSNPKPSGSTRAAAGTTEPAGQARNLAGSGARPSAGSSSADPFRGITDSSVRDLAKSLGISAKALREQAALPGYKDLLDALRELDRPAARDAAASSSSASQVRPSASEPDTRPIVRAIAEGFERVGESLRRDAQTPTGGSAGDKATHDIGDVIGEARRAATGDKTRAAAAEGESAGAARAAASAPPTAAGAGAGGAGGGGEAGAAAAAAGEAGEGAGVGAAAAGAGEGAAAAAGMAEVAAAAGPAAIAILGVEISAEQVIKATDRFRDGVQFAGAEARRVAGNDYLGALADGSEKAAKELEKHGVAGKVAASEIRAATAVVTEFSKTVDAFVRRGRELAAYDARLAAANAQADVRKLESDIAEARALGDSVGRLTESQSRIEANFRELLLPLKELLAEILADVAEGVADITELLTAFRPLIQAGTQVVKFVEQAAASEVFAVIRLLDSVLNSSWIKKLVGSPQQKDVAALNAIMREFLDAGDHLPGGLTVPDPIALDAQNKIGLPLLAN
jgi:hypothetical protein